MQATETYRPAFKDANIPYISYGLPFEVACTQHVIKTFDAKRVYIIVSKSLVEKSTALRRLEDALEPRVAGLKVGMKPHTLWSEVLDATEDCRACNADLIITLGAGSLTDAAKIVSLVRYLYVMCESFAMAKIY